MPNPIGNCFRSIGMSRHLLTAISFALVAVDLTGLPGFASWFRLIQVPVIVLVLGTIARWDCGSLGLVLVPLQGWGVWIRLTIRIAILMSFLVASYLAILVLLGFSISTRPVDNSHFLLRWIFFSCVFFPLVEEGIYRFALCVTATASIGFWSTIALSGAAFVALHFRYNNLSPENIVGGFVLAWCYLKSGCILVPIALHVLGNFVVILGHLAYFYTT